MYNVAEPFVGGVVGGVGVVDVVVEVVLLVVLVLVAVDVVVGVLFAGAAPLFDAVATAAGASTTAAVKARTRPRVRGIKRH
jgi:hypothetical protein